MQVVTIPPAPPTWRLTDPCGSCRSCQERARGERAVGYLDEHFARTIENLDQHMPGYLRAVDRLMAEREQEVGRIRSELPHCEVRELEAV